MSTSYTMTPHGVNPSAHIHLSARVISFYRWITKLSKQAGFCWARNSYLAAKQGVDDATITRWIARLQAAGWLRCEHITGVERHIFPLQPAPRTLRPTPAESPRTATPAPVNAVMQQSDNAEGVAEGLRGVSPSVPSYKNHALRNNRQAAPLATDTAPEADVVAALLDQGISRQVAVVLVADHGAEAVADQVEALPHRRADDKAAVLVAAIKGAWGLPQRLRVARDKAREEQARRARAAAAVAQEAQRERERGAQEHRLAALSPEALAALVAQARAVVAREHPVVWRGGPEKVGCQALVKTATLRLLAAQDEPYPT